ncbi:MAG: metallophosphoesterase [Clostridia bacterium]|nr:metallophosphoesterase [Clostridia bacterium]
MSLYAISDLHLPLGVNKPMDIFGDSWRDYVERLEANWKMLIKENDYVVLPGDFSWAMYLEESMRDFEFINRLNGIKILLKGNHDYWWTTMNKLNTFIKEKSFKNIHFLHNNSYLYKDIAICGTRGWLYPDTGAASDEDEKIYAREAGRLEVSIQSALQSNPAEIIVFMHYPPISKSYMETPLTRIMQKYNVKRCIYGHLHAAAQKHAVEGMQGGIEYSLVSCDYRQFTPVKLCD